mmetsp:Transcript_145411/g.268144  ORF Transcript_145411/g.268144 Transcript_145411/m.268144 type:complete len:221 (+) Transcript_145411:130-792(+)
MGNQGSGEIPQKIDPMLIWKEFDRDNSGTMDPQEVEQMLQTLWKRYGVQRPLSKEFINALMAELDVNGDGIVMREEFIEVAEELWDERDELFAQTAVVSLAGAGLPEAPEGPSGEAEEPGLHDKDPLDRSEWICCPHCDFDIDPRDLDDLIEELAAVKRPEELGYGWELSRQNAALGSATSSWQQGHRLPEGSTVQGTAPGSYFQNPYGWWTADRSVMRF